LLVVVAQPSGTPKSPLFYFRDERNQTGIGPGEIVAIELPAKSYDVSVKVRYSAGVLESRFRVDAAQTGRLIALPGRSPQQSLSITPPIGPFMAGTGVSENRIRVAGRDQASRNSFAAALARDFDIELLTTADTAQGFLDIAWPSPAVPSKDLVGLAEKRGLKIIWWDLL
jgi:hypothetical protein